MEETGQQEIEASDVVQLILQFLSEQKLTNTATTLQAETSVTLNTVANRDKLLKNIVAGKWSSVLPHISSLSLPKETAFLLYESLVDDLLTEGEFELCRKVVREVPVFQEMKQTDASRYIAWERRIQAVSTGAVQSGLTDEARKNKRQKISHQIDGYVQAVEPSRLLTLIGQALKWQEYTGSLPKGGRYNLFEGKIAAFVEEDERVITQISRSMKVGSKKNYPEIAQFSPNGKYLVSGSSDGFIEFWDIETGKLDESLIYQTTEEFLMHDVSITAMAFNTTSELLASGSSDGVIKIWRVESGTCVLKLPKQHTQAISQLCFSADSTQLLSGCYDETLNIFGLKSGRSLKQYTGNSSFVTDALWCEKEKRVVSAATDGTIKIFDALGRNVVASVNAFQSIAAISKQSDAKRGPSAIVPVTAMRILPGQHPSVPPSVGVCTSSESFGFFDLTGKLSRVITTQSTLKSCCFSPKGKFVYLLDEDSVVYCYDTFGNYINAMKTHDKEANGLCHHPNRNLLATWGKDGRLKLWSP